MINYRHYQGLSMPMSSHYWVRKSRRFPYQDRFFRLPTVLAQNDIFLRRLYSVVSFYLDDHPYPSTPEDFHRRTYEIKQNVRDLNLSSEQHQFLQRLQSETGVSLVDLWQGSHIITLDNGYLYDTWSRLPSAHPRKSSHYKQVRLPQYGIDFRDHQLLFGKTSPNGSTWFQMEAHGFDAADIYNDPNLFVYHGQDFLKYRIHQMNVGPFGFSPHTEMFDPLILPYQPITLKTKSKRSRFRILRKKMTHLEENVGV